MRHDRKQDSGMCMFGDQPGLCTIMHSHRPLAPQPTATGPILNSQVLLLLYWRATEQNTVLLLVLYWDWEHAYLSDL